VSDRWRAISSPGLSDESPCLSEASSGVRGSQSCLSSVPGAYGLLFDIGHDIVVPTGRLGSLKYSAGWYTYIGSALGGLSGRVGHHLRADKRLHWHIDRLLQYGGVDAVVVTETSQRVECDLACFMVERFEVIPRFGSSDCRCRGHLFYSRSRSHLLEAMLEAVKLVGCQPKVIPRSSLPIGTEHQQP
jgi:Uri superfamily endonuclease